MTDHFDQLGHLEPFHSDLFFSFVFLLLDPLFSSLTHTHTHTLHHVERIHTVYTCTNNICTNTYTFVLTVPNSVQLSVIFQLETLWRVLPGFFDMCPRALKCVRVCVCVCVCEGG